MGAWWKKRAVAQLADFGRRHRWLPWAVVLVPSSAMCTVLVTVATCLRWWRDGPNAASGLIFPAISELGVALPEKRLYQLGFGVGGALMSAGILLFELLVEPQLLQHVAAAEGGLQAKKERGLMDNMMTWGHASAAGVVIQGVFTLERVVSLQCFIHWGGAMLFMGGAIQHAKASVELYDILSRQTPVGGTAAGSSIAKRILADPGVIASSRLRHIIINYASLVLFSVPLLAQFFPAWQAADVADGGAVAASAEPSRPEPPMDIGMMNIMGLMQWGIIMQFAVFFCTYAADLRAAAAQLS